MFLSYQLMTKLFRPNMFIKILWWTDRFLLYENHYCLITNLHNFFRKNEHYKDLCRRCLNTYGDQIKLGEHMLRCMEQKVCNISYMPPNQKTKFIDWYLEIDPPMWMAGDFEFLNVPINDDNNDHVTDKLFVNKPVSIT